MMTAQQTGKTVSHTPTNSRRIATLACAAAALAAVAGCGSGSGGSKPPDASPSTNPSTSTMSSPAAPSTAPSTASVSSSAAPGTSSAGAGSGPTEGVARCHTRDLSAAFSYRLGSSGMGHVGYIIELTNTSAHPCTVYGHPGLQLLDAHHKPLPTHVQWNGQVPNRVVTLAPAASASASAYFSPDIPGVGDAQSGACQPVAAYTEITAPNETTHLVVPVTPPTSVCERGTMSVSALVAGTKGPGAG